MLTHVCIGSQTAPALRARVRPSAVWQTRALQLGYLPDLHSDQMFSSALTLSAAMVVSAADLEYLCLRAERQSSTSFLNYTVDSRSIISRFLYLTGEVYLHSYSF